MAENVNSGMLPPCVPLLKYKDIIERLRNYAGQQNLFCHDNERVAKELNELADTIESGQNALIEQSREA